jgi:inner membrane protein YidH
MTTAAASPADTGTRLAVDRTRLAYERTMMAWVRTGTSLISFGFTIYKFFQYETDRRQVAATAHLIGPRGFALMMIGTGLVALLLATLEHRQSMQMLRATYGPQPKSVAAVVAGLVSVMGLLAFIATLSRA